MSYVLSVICTRPSRNISGTEGPIVLQKADQGIGAEHRACYLRTLQIYFGDRIEHAACYHVFVDVGSGYFASWPFFDEPANDEQSPVLRVPQDLRAHFGNLLKQVFEVSTEHTATVLCEYNGDISSPTHGLAVTDPKKLTVSSCADLDAFWNLHDSAKILEPSLTVING